MSLLKEFINNIEGGENFTNVKNALEKKGLVVKENENLYLIKYDRNKCNIDSDLLRQSRGIILEKNTNKIICYPLDGAIEKNIFKTKNNWSDIVVEKSIDGTLINLYYYSGKWNVSTKSVIDGNCYWNNEQRTFKQLFEEVLESLNFNYDLLDNSLNYSFVLCHPKERNVTKYEEAKIYHISSRNIHTLRECDINIGIPKPEILKLDNFNLLNINSYTDLENSLKDLDYSQEGYMLYTKNRMERVKFKGIKHCYVKELKGNHPNTLFHLLEIRLNENKLKDFLRYFPEYFELATNIEVAIDELSQAILFFYTKTKKNKENIEIPKLYQKPIIELHQEYLKLMDRYNPKKHSYKPSITLPKIIHYLNYEIEVKYLYHLITFHDKDQSK
jgi:hypothetical protein